MSEPNSDLVATQQQLAEVIDALRKAIEKTNDPDEIKRLLIEMDEVRHRFNVLSQLIFHAQTEAIADAAKDVEKATEGVKKAIKEIDKLNAFLTTITNFLGLVDKVLDLAKLI